MKKTLLLGLASLALVAGSAAAFALSSNAAREVSAYDKDTVYYYLTGNFGGVDHWTDYIAAPSDGSNVGVLKKQELAAGDTFKFKKPTTWDDALDFGDVFASSGASQAFYWKNGGTDIYCGASGLYDFYIWDDGGTIRISVEFSDTNTATYSYVLALDSEVDHVYSWNGGQKQREWASAPAVNGQAYDIKFNYAEYDYYGLYRIDDRILNGWPNFLLKKEDGSKQTGDIARTAGNTQEAYIIHWVDDPESEDPEDGEWNVVTKTKTSDEYKALDFLYDLVAHRGGATYDGFGFAYSICATDPVVADELAKTYDGFSDSIKTLLSKAQLNTYSLEGAHAEGNKAYANVADMVETMKIIVAKNKGLGGANQVLGGLQESNNAATLITVALVSLASIALGGFFVFHKKRAK